MRLQLSLWAEDLSNTAMIAGLPDLMAVLTVLNPDSKPELLGQTEQLKGTQDPDWTKLFYLEDFELGQTTNVVVSIYSMKNRKKTIGSTVFEVGSVLGAPGSRIAKRLKDGGVVVLHVEAASDLGSLDLKLKGLKLKNTEGAGLINKSDPFFELQRLRKASGRGKVWDTVFRSTHCTNDLNPNWPQGSVEINALCGGQLDQQFRFVVYDHDADGSHDQMSWAMVSVNDLLTKALNGENENAIVVKKAGEEVGQVIVEKARITGAPATHHVEGSGTKPQEEPEIDVQVAESADEIIVEPTDEKRPSFAEYIEGGCELRVVVAVDATASNGDPRKETSLHHFKDDGPNSYEQVLFALCSMLSKYDSDQVYPMWGFGAKREGKISHDFDIGAAKGVEDIAAVYRNAFRSGIVMSSPRDFSAVIRRAAKDAKQFMETKQCYTTLLLFTNGSPADIDLTKSAIKDAKGAPLSIVIVGVGESGDYSALQELTTADGFRAKLCFVDYKRLEGNNAALTRAALDKIPQQLVTYFMSEGVYPQEAPDEIAVEPYNEATDIEVPLEINEEGQATVTGDIEPDKREKLKGWMKTGGRLFLKHGQLYMKKNKRQIGRIRQKYERRLWKMLG